MNNVVIETRPSLAETLFMTAVAVNAIETLAKTGRSSGVVWEGEVPELPVKQNGWKLAPVVAESDLPIEVQRRINIIKRQGIPIKEILIAHELPPPKPLAIPEFPPKVSVPSTEPLQRPSKSKNDILIIQDILKGLGIGLAIIAGVVGAVGAFFVSLLLLPLMLPLLALLAIPLVVVYDPIVVVVLDDSRQTWLSIGFWYE